MMYYDERPGEISLLPIPLPVRLCFEAVGEQMVRPQQKHMFLALEDHKKTMRVHETVCAC